MANTSSRTLRLLSLLQTHRYWPGAELADRLEVSVRTLRRDVDRLRELGYPVEANRGVDGGYQLAAGAAMPPLVLDDEEAVALAVGLQAAAKGGVAGVGGGVGPRAGQGGAGDAAPAAAAGRCAADGDGPGDVRRRRAGRRPGDRSPPSRRPAATPSGWSSATPPPTVPRTDRLVEPFRLVPLGRRWYLVAYDLYRHDWRSFRLDRLDAPRRTGARFRPATCPPTTRRRSSGRPAQSPDLLRCGGAGRRACRRRPRPGRSVGERRGGRRGLPHTDEHGLARLGRAGGRRGGSRVHGREPGRAGSAPSRLGGAVRPFHG